MALIKKLGTAVRILFTEGVGAFIRAFRQYLGARDGAYRPDESGIVFAALGADKVKGVMIDVGAHHGGALAPFARSGWQVYAFEPDSINREKLAANFGELPNVVIDSRAVSDHLAEKAILYRSKESTGISGLSSFHPSHQAGEEVEVTTLDEFLASQGLEDQEITFLKVDTEGFDLHVLRGFPWQKTSPRVILCEFEDSKTLPLGYTFQDLADFLVEKGYRLVVSEWHPVEKYDLPHHWRRFTPYPCHLEHPQAWGNIFAVRDDGDYNSLLQICHPGP